MTTVVILRLSQAEARSMPTSNICRIGSKPWGFPRRWLYS